MTEFTASNGITIATHRKDPALGFGIYLSDGCSSLDNSFDHLNGGEMQALREFFEHERDEALGRWRWPENPDCVVYPLKKSVTLDEDREFRDRRHPKSHAWAHIEDDAVTAGRRIYPEVQS